MWVVIGDRLATTDLTTTNIFQPIISDRNISVVALRTWIIFYNNPPLTALGMKVYANSGGVPGSLIATSQNTFTKAEMITLNNGIKEIYFTFDNLNFRMNDIYHAVLFGTGYTGSESSHIAWRVGYPDPVYNTITSIAQAGRAPREISTVIGAEV